MSDGPSIPRLGESSDASVPVQYREFVYPDESTDVRAHGPDRAEGAAAIYLWQDMLSELIYAALRSPETMQAALLIGELVQSSVGRAIEVRGYVGLDKYDDLVQFARETADAWDITQNRIERASPGYLCLGWALSNPAQEEELSERERLTHRTFFNLPFQVMLRIQPRTEETSLFGFDENGWLIQTGFNVVHKRESPMYPDELKELETNE
jgi:hypothetical protein